MKRPDPSEFAPAVTTLTDAAPRPLESRLSALAAAHDDHPHVPGPSLWPVGFAVGIVVLLVGLVISWWVVGRRRVIALVFAFLWVRDLTAGTALAHAPEVEPETGGRGRAAERGDASRAVSPRSATRARSSSRSRRSASARVIGGARHACRRSASWSCRRSSSRASRITTSARSPTSRRASTSSPRSPRDRAQGEVSRRTAFVRYNGRQLGKQAQPSFTIISNHCAHLGCPVQPNGPLDDAHTEAVPAT